MEKTQDKIETFEYIVSKIIEWYKNIKNINNDEDFNEGNDLSKLKIMKLLFFISAINSENDSQLLEIFDKYYAMPYGHVESDIYDSLEEIKRYDITDRRLTIKKQNDFTLQNGLEEFIDKNIKELKEINKELIKYRGFDLVHISHKWLSWRLYYELARKNNKYSELIPTNIIQMEQKYFK